MLTSYSNKWLQISADFSKSAWTSSEIRKRFAQLFLHVVLLDTLKSVKYPLHALMNGEISMVRILSLNLRQSKVKATSSHSINFFAARSWTNSALKDIEVAGSALWKSLAKFSAEFNFRFHLQNIVWRIDKLFDRHAPVVATCTNQKIF